MVAPSDINAILPPDDAERQSQWDMRNRRGAEDAERRYDTNEIANLVHRVYAVFGLRPQLVRIDEDWESAGWTMTAERHYSFAERHDRRYIVGPEDAVRNAFTSAIELSAHIQRATNLEDMGIALNDAPPWSFLMHAVPHALLTHMGIDPVEATRADTSKRTHPSFRPQLLTRIHRGHSLEGSLFSSIDGMHARISRLDTEGISYHESAFVSITLQEEGMREPRDYVGMTVGEATGHPALADVPVRIRDAWRNGGVQMQLDPVFMPVEPMPDGAGGHWARHLPTPGDPLWRT